MRSINRMPGSLIVWITSYLFFLFTLVNNFSASHDSIHYLNDIVMGKNLFHQHHLYYHFLANKWLYLWKGLFGCKEMMTIGGPEAGKNIVSGLIFCRDHYLIQSFTAIWGSSALSVIYLMFRRRFYLSRRLSWLGTALIGVSYGFWCYSVNIEVYLPPLFFILLCLYTLTKKEYNESTAWKLAVFHSLAILFHQMNILFAAIALFSLWKKKMYRPMLQYAILGFVITAGTYFIIGWYVEGHNSMGQWMSWIEGYAVGHGYWQPLNYKTPLYALTGFARAFTGGHFLFQLPVLEAYLQQSFASHALRDEIYLSANIDGGIAWGLTILAIITAIVILVLVIRFLLRYQQMEMHDHVIGPLLRCLLVYSVFFCFWMPEILEFWILQMVIVWLVLIGMLPVIRFPFGISAARGTMSLVALMFILNYFGSMRWLQNLNNDWYYIETRKVAPLVGPDDLIIVEDNWILKDYLRCFLFTSVVATDDGDYSQQQTDSLIARKRSAGNKVFFYKLSGTITRAY